MSKQSLKITVITSSFTRFRGDGIAPFVKSICDNLSSLGHEIQVVAPYDPDIQPMNYGEVKVTRFKYIFLDRFHQMGHSKSIKKDVKIKIQSILLLPLYLISAVISLMKVSMRKKTDIIYAHWILPSGLVAAIVSRIINIPFMVSLHGTDVYISTRYQILTRVAKWVLKKAKIVTVPSTSLYSAAKKFGLHDNVYLIPWGTDPDVFRPDCRTREVISCENNLHVDFRIVALGRMVYKKGFIYLIASFSSVVKEYPNAKLIIGGEGELREELLDLGAEYNLHDSLSLPGMILHERVPEFLANADLFIMPSIIDEYGNFEGFGIVMLEAMSCGVPVIASDIGGAQLVIQNEENGIIVPPGDTKALEISIIRLIQNDKLREKLRLAARETVINKFNWQYVCCNLAALINEAIKE
jgi:glycosyltransferase involved in cell wall biosynthesis